MEVLNGPLERATLGILLVRCEAFARMALLLVAPDRYRAIYPLRGIARFLDDRALAIGSGSTLNPTNHPPCAGPPASASRWPG